MPPWSASQTISQLRLCRGNSTQHSHISVRQLVFLHQSLSSQKPIITVSSLSDVANVIQACYGETPPPIVLIGHGVGGAIAVHTASNMLLPTTVGLVAIDVVEGTSASSRGTAWHIQKHTPCFITPLVFASSCRQCNGGTPQHTELPKGKTQVLQVHGPRYRMEVSI